jgi:hypothetical protein
MAGGCRRRSGERREDELWAMGRRSERVAEVVVADDHARDAPTFRVLDREPSCRGYCTIARSVG